MENGHVTEVGSNKEGACSCYSGGHFKGGRKVMLQRCCHSNGARKVSLVRMLEVVSNGGRIVMLRRWPV